MWALLFFIVVYAIVTGLAKLIGLPTDDSKDSKTARGIFFTVIMALVIVAGLLLTSLN